MGIRRLIGLAFCLFCACGGQRGAQPAQAPVSSSAESAKGGKAEESAAQPGATPSSPPAAEYAAPPPPAPSPAAPSGAATKDRAEAPETVDPRTRYARANVQLSEARREVEIATSQRDCATACRALDSMERAAAQLCELARSTDERRTCKSAEDQVGAARDRVHSACGDCPKKSR
jgi:hypothetical protein